MLRSSRDLHLEDIGAWYMYLHTYIFLNKTQNYFRGNMKLLFNHK